MASDTTDSPPNSEAEVDVTTAAPRRGLKHHKFMLGLSVFALVMSFALEVIPEGRVAFRGFESHPLPHSCSMRMMFDFDCPGCGLTRGYIHLANARWQESLAIHRLAWLMMVLTVIQIPYRLAAIYGSNSQPIGTTVPKMTAFVLIGLLFVNWLYGIIFL